jgi:hypothetical protein
MVVLQSLKTQKLEKGVEDLTPKTPENQSPETKNQTNEGNKLTKGETRTAPDIRVQASVIEKKVLAFCLDPRKKNKSIKN